MILFLRKTLLFCLLAKQYSKFLSNMGSYFVVVGLYYTLNSGFTRLFFRLFISVIKYIYKAKQDHWSTQKFNRFWNFLSIILLSLFFRNMSQLLTKHFSPTRQSSGSTIVSANPQQILINTRLETKKFSMSQIIIQVIRILSNESQLCQQDLQIINSSKTISDVLLFLRYSPFKQSLKTSNRQITFRAKIGCKCDQQILELKRTLDNKNLIIMKLNQGYQQTKQIHKQQLIHKQKHIGCLKKQICQLKNENQILSQKLSNLKMHKQLPQQQRKNYNINMVASMNKIESTQAKREDINSKYIQKHRSSSNESRRSSYQELKDLLEVMSNKIQGLQQIQQTLSSKQRSHKYHNQSLVNFGSNSKRISQICGSPPSKNTIKKKYYHSSKYQKLQSSDQLVHQVAELRQNQSKLLDKICQRDEIISQLMKMNQKGQNGQISYNKMQ